MNFLELSFRTKLVFVTTGIFIGLLVSAQIHSAIPTGAHPYDQLTIQKDLIKSFIDDQTRLKSTIVSLRKKIEENQQALKEQGESANLEILHGLKQDLGLESAKGEGIEINLNDGALVNRENMEALDQSLVHASDLRDIINLLRASQADAIAINDQRVIASTPISSVGNTILVNNFHLLPPFHIVAIGDSEYLRQRLNDPKNLPDLQKRIQEGKIQFEFSPKSNLTAPLYNGNLSFQYLKETAS